MIKPDRSGDVTLASKSDEFWKAFFKRPAHAFGIPNEMTDAKGGEIFAGVPGGQTGDAAIAFILPDLLSDSDRVSIRNMYRFGGPSDAG